MYGCGQSGALTGCGKRLLLLIRRNGLQLCVRLQFVSNGLGNQSVQPINGCIFSLSWLCRSISLITLITLQLVGYLMLSPWLTVWLGIRLIFPRAFYKQPCVPPVPVGWTDVAAEFTTSEALWPHSHCNTLFKFMLSLTESGGQLFEYPQECSWSAATHLQLQRRWNCLTPADQGCGQWNTIIYNTVWYFSEVIDSPVSDLGKDDSRIHRM